MSSQAVTASIIRGSQVVVTTIILAVSIKALAVLEFIMINQDLHFISQLLLNLISSILLHSIVDTISLQKIFSLYYTYCK